MSLHRCDQCLKDYPVDMFPNLSVGMICRSCMTGEKNRKMELAIKDKAKSVASRICEVGAEELSAADSVKVKQILGDIYGSFGGTTSFAEHLHWVIMELSNRRPIPSAVGTLMINLMKLHHQIEAQEQQVEAREMTDEQLKRETELAAMKLFVETASDSERRKMLDSILGKHGLVITEADVGDVIGESLEEKVEELLQGDMP